MRQSEQRDKRQRNGRERHALGQADWGRLIRIRGEQLDAGPELGGRGVGRRGAARGVAVGLARSGHVAASERERVGSVLNRGHVALQFAREPPLIEGGAEQMAERIDPQREGGCDQACGVALSQVGRLMQQDGLELLVINVAEQRMVDLDARAQNASRRRGQTEPFDDTNQGLKGSERGRPVADPSDALRARAAAVEVVDRLLHPLRDSGILDAARDALQGQPDCEQALDH